MDSFPLIGNWFPERSSPLRVQRPAQHENADFAFAPKRPAYTTMTEYGADIPNKFSHQQPRARPRAFEYLAHDEEMQVNVQRQTSKNSTDSFTPMSDRGSEDSAVEQALADMSRIAARHASEVQNHVQQKIPGNIYTYWAFEPVLEQLHCVGLRDGQSKLFCLAFVTIMIVQVVAPVAVLVNTTYKLDTKHAKIGLGDWHYERGSYQYGVSNLMSHLLGTLFLFLFNLNAIQITRADREAALRIGTIIHGLSDKRGVVVNRLWLWVGAVINCWVVTICCVTMWPCFMIALNPKDVIFDALSLCFLWQIDDANGVFNFLENRWDEDFFGSLYKHFTDEEDLRSDHSEEGSEPLVKAEAVATWTIVYEVTVVVLYLLLLTVPLSFIFVEGIHAINLFENEIHSEVDVLRQDVSLMDARLNLIAASGET